MLGVAVILTILFIFFFLCLICDSEDYSHKGWTILLLILGIGTTVCWFLWANHWSTGLTEEKIIITEAIAKVTGEKEADIASLVYLCDGDATIAEMLQIIDKNITEEEAKNFESLILKQTEEEE